MRLFGVYRGTVTANTDPQGSGRVQVQVMALGSTSMWAPACAAPGSSLATYPVGCTVIVAFEGGDASFPVVLGRVG